jgi:hypothetical protein
MSYSENLARCIVERATTIRHEAGHAAMAVLVGRDVYSVRVDSGFDHYGLFRCEGTTNVKALQPDVDDAIEFLEVILAGHLASGRPNWPPRWPLTEPTPVEGRATDEDWLERLVPALRLDEAGYRALTSRAEERFLSAEFSRLEHGIGFALEQFGSLDRNQFAEVVAAVRRHSRRDPNHVAA